jgi:ribosomal protein L23
VTEKAHQQLDQLGAYTFVVKVDANKIEIARRSRSSST